MSLMIAVGMLSLLATSATAGVFLPQSSTLEIKLGALQNFTVQGTYNNGGWATLTNNGADHDLSDTTGVWTTAGNAVGTSLLTGVALISNLTLTVTNLAGNFTAGFSALNPVGGGLSPASATPNSGTLCPGGCLGGTEGFNGKLILALAGFPNATMPLTNNLGVGGTTVVSLLGQTIPVEFGPFITGKVRITGIGTNVISMPDRGNVTGVAVTLVPAATEEVKTFTTLGGFVTTNPGGILETQGTVVLSGTNNLASASQAGQVTLISPIRFDVGALGLPVLPGFASKTFVFVPEPGTVLLLVSGAAGLVFIGRKRMKG
ncbi:MAG: PEP-CTERM sorting domain-containing protein [Deltaproteobacteria bacterium]|nr:PEP-CTERM sorting domain-containing protein [Deltaproteobacteria bacterium]